MSDMICPECAADRGQDAATPTGQSPRIYRCPVCRAYWYEARPGLWLRLATWWTGGPDERLGGLRPGPASTVAG